MSRYNRKIKHIFLLSIVLVICMSQKSANEDKSVIEDESWFRYDFYVIQKKLESQMHDNAKQIDSMKIELSKSQIAIINKNYRQ